MNFTPEHKDILDRHRHYIETFKATQVYMGTPEVYSDLQRVYHQAVGPYTFTSWCPACVAELLTTVYRLYDQWLEEEPIQFVDDTNQKKDAKKRK